MFNITQGKGFHITFANGYTASVQWGKGNYCENRYGEDGNKSATAECAAWPAWPKEGGLIDMGNGDIVAAYQSPSEVLAFLNRIAAL